MHLSTHEQLTAETKSYGVHFLINVPVKCTTHRLAPWRTSYGVSLANFLARAMIAWQVTYVGEGLLEQGQEAFFLHGLNPANQHLLGALQHAGVSLQPVLQSCCFAVS